MENNSESENALNDHADRVLGPKCPKAPTVVSVALGKPSISPADQRSFDELVSENLSPEWRVAIRRVEPYRWPERDGTRLIVGEVARWPVERIEILQQKIIDAFGGGTYKLVLSDSCGNICRTAEITIPTETCFPKGAAGLERQIAEKAGSIPQGATVFGNAAVPQYPVGKPVKQMLRPMGEFKSSLTLDQVIKQNERLISALVETNQCLMSLCERLAGSNAKE